MKFFKQKLLVFFKNKIFQTGFYFDRISKFDKLFVDKRLC